VSVRVDEHRAQVRKRREHHREADRQDKEERAPAPLTRDNPAPGVEHSMITERDRQSTELRV
jgi:hypothetical protein